MGVLKHFALGTYFLSEGIETFLDKKLSEFLVKI